MFEEQPFRFFLPAGCFFHQKTPHGADRGRPVKSAYGLFCSEQHGEIESQATEAIETTAPEAVHEVRSLGADRANEKILTVM